MSRGREISDVGREIGREFSPVGSGEIALNKLSQKRPLDTWTFLHAQKYAFSLRIVFGATAREFCLRRVFQVGLRCFVAHFEHIWVSEKYFTPLKWQFGW